MYICRYIFYTLLKICIYNLSNVITNSVNQLSIPNWIPPMIVGPSFGGCWPLLRHWFISLKKMCAMAVCTTSWVVNCCHSDLIGLHVNYRLYQRRIICPSCSDNWHHCFSSFFYIDRIWLGARSYSVARLPACPISQSVSLICQAQAKALEWMNIITIRAAKGGGNLVSVIAAGATAGILIPSLSALVQGTLKTY